VDFNKARTFVEVVDRGGITAAAAHLKRTQQAISMQIQSLEEDLDIALLYRQGPKVVLTEAGERLYHSFKSNFLSLERATQDVKSDRTKLTGVIKIGTTIDCEMSYLPEVIQGFSKEFPLVSYEILTGQDIETEKMLLDNTIDIGFLVKAKNIRMLQKKPIYHEELLPVVSRGYLKNNPMPKTLKDTLDIPVIDFQGEYGVYNIWIKKNQRNLLPAAKKKIKFIQTGNPVSIKKYTLQGMGLGFVIKSSIEKELKSGELVQLSLPKNIKTVSYTKDVVYKRKNSLGYVHHAFIDYLQENSKGRLG